MIRHLRSVFLAAALAAAALLASTVARAAIPTTYTGKPFDPAVAGGPKCPPTVKAGPYTIPGRLDFVNYDMGGDGITFHTGDHLVKGGTGYRVDNPPTATFSLTTACAPTCPNVWYDTSPALDGTVYPSATTGDFSIGAVQNGDWMDITVNVTTSGTYTLSSTWATGNGPPGGEGGDGTIGLIVFSNDVKLATWSAIFPNFNTTADFRHWKAYPNFATVQLQAGPQVIKLQSGAKHLQLDYVQFELVGADGGTTPMDGGATADVPKSSGEAGAGGSPGTAGGAGGATGVAGGSPSGTGGVAGSSTGAAGDGSSAGGSGGPGAAGSSAIGTAGSTASGSAGSAGQLPKGSSGGCSCSTAGETTRGLPLGAGLIALGCVLVRRRPRARK
jgi:MYXO-CTERM domain-containing protein